jgi:hypothetical protein
VVAKTNYDIELVCEDISWKEACEQEITLIKHYGRSDLGLGSLVNMTDGGDGAFNPSIEVREKLRQAKMGKSPNKGVKRLDLSNRNRSNKGKPAWNRGLKNPDRSESQRGSKNHRFGKKGKQNLGSKPCKIDDVVYESAGMASEALNINYYTLTKRLTSTSKKYSAWVYVLKSSIFI